MLRVSVLTAFLNEESNLPLLRERITLALQQAGVDYEIVLIDDHSTDRSPAIASFEWAWIRCARR